MNTALLGIFLWHFFCLHIKYQIEYVKIEKANINLNRINVSRVNQSNKEHLTIDCDH